MTKPPNCEIWYGDSRIASINSVEELEKVLVQVRRNFKPSNPILGMVHLSGNCLHLGISSRGCYVQYIDASKLPPYYSVLGDPTLTEADGVLPFFYSGSLSEILKRYIIPFKDLLRVAKAFFSTGTRPETVIEWEET